MLNELKECLGQLIDITDNFTPLPVFSSEEYGDLQESVLLLIDEYMSENILLMAEPNFHTVLFHEIYDILFLQNHHLIHDDKFDNELKSIIDDSISNYFTTIIPKRSYPTTFIRKTNPNKEKLTKKIHYLKNVPQPDQRTTEWYEFRYNLLTASTAWKGLDSRASINSLIYEKCQPLNTDKYNHVNTSSPFHHGTIYEPISISIYEKKYDTTVEDFGCIADNNHYFLGASPDGINVDINSSRYARMLEVKNIVNREISGIPKKEYWTQMQIQMGVCQLNECDFLETKFTEYEDKQSFDDDGSFNYSKDKKMKGIFVYFIKDGKPYYEYPPIGLSQIEFAKWEQEIMEKNKDLTWNKNIYWKLDVYSCVLVLRNKKWFDTAVEKLHDVWKIIEKERVTGYSHRAPKSSGRKSNYTSPVIKPFSGCVINIDFDNITINENAKSIEQSDNSSIIKISTETLSKNN